MVSALLVYAAIAKMKHEVTVESLPHTQNPVCEENLYSCIYVSIQLANHVTVKLCGYSSRELLTMNITNIRMGKIFDPSEFDSGMVVAEFLLEKSTENGATIKNSWKSLVSDRNKIHRILSVQVK